MVLMLMIALLSDDVDTVTDALIWDDVDILHRPNVG
jgi:hypothetical protein